MDLLMKKLLFVGLLLCSLLTQPVFAKVEPCFLIVEDTGDYHPAKVTSFAIALISQYIREVKPIPKAGIRESDCQYTINLSENREGLSVSLSGQGIAAFGDTDKSGFKGVQQAIIKAIYRAHPDKKKIICEVYDCGEESEKMEVGINKSDTVEIRKSNGQMEGTPLDTLIEIKNLSKQLENLEERVDELDEEGDLPPDLEESADLISDKADHLEIQVRLFSQEVNSLEKSMNSERDEDRRDELEELFSDHEELLDDMEEELEDIWKILEVIEKDWGNES